MKVYLRRFFYFGIGVFLGSLVVMALFGDRDIQCSYFPNDRVLYDMRGKEMTVAPYVECLMECYDFPDSNYAFVFRESKVDFKNSEAKMDKVCKTYPLEWKNNAKEKWWILVNNCTDTIVVLDLKPLGEKTISCNCP
ncbi:MAG: hypothetical protein EA358_04150 [Flavobacteriales bacterium]|nr:MAG: hypothetical protein EA358_04150 [Flavobacteriales bacterium]